MILDYPRRLLAIAVFLMVLGVVLPFLMVLHILESTFFLNFLSYGASVLGLFLGVASVASIRIKGNKNRDDDQYHRHK